MNNHVGQFVALPDFLQLRTSNLKYLDALTYISIRSFLSSTTDECYPSYEAIMTRSGLSRSFVADSIKRLEGAALINVKHSTVKGLCNQYSFTKIHRFEMIPYDLFTIDDLTVNEKSMLLCLRQFFNHGLLCSSNSIKDFAKYIGLTYKQVYGPFKSLLAKGYIRATVLGRQTAAKLFKVHHLTGKIDWFYDTSLVQRLQEHIKLKVA